MTPSEAFKSHPVMLISNLLVIVGALNWLAVGLLKADYVTQFAGSENAKYVFIAVGLAGVYLAYHKLMWFMGKTTKETAVAVEHMTGCKQVNGKLVCQ
jgi:uncharacterized membrane protein YuzA (DUF378 family)